MTAAAVQYLEVDAPASTASPAPTAINQSAAVSCWFIAGGGWLLVLLGGWGLTRLLCDVAGLPSDCRDLDQANAMLDLTALLEKGIVVAALTRLPTSVLGLSVRARVGWASVTVISGPVFSALGEVPDMQRSLTSDLEWNAASAGYLAIGTFVLLVVGAHGVSLRRTPHFRLYVASRLGLAAFYAAFLATLGARSRLHFHHCYVGLWVALLGFDAGRLSLGLIAVGSGIMVQGIGAYDWANLVNQ